MFPTFQSPFNSKFPLTSHPSGLCIDKDKKKSEHSLHCLLQDGKECLKRLRSLKEDSIVLKSTC